jgi:hypothetical protein
MMSDETMFESEIVKSLHKLDEILSKAQIQSGGQSDVEWSGGDTEEYDSDSDTKWDDDIDDDGTDYKKGIDGAKHDVLKAQEDEEEEDDDDDEEKAGYGLPPVRKGVEVSEFLNELAKSIAVYCSQLEDTVEKSLQQMHYEQGEVAKAIAHNLDVLSGVLSKSESNIVQYADEPARGPKSMLDMSKSVEGSAPTDGIDKSMVLSALVKGVEAGTVSPLEVIKCEQLGVQAVSHDVVKSLLA